MSSRAPSHWNNQLYPASVDESIAPKLAGDGIEVHCQPFLETVGYGGSQNVGRRVLRAQEQCRKGRFGLLEASTNCELFVVSEGRADNSEVIASHYCASHCLIEGDDEIGAVAR